MENKNIAYQWKPIEDINQSWENLRRTEINSLSEIWLEQRDQLTQTQAVNEFNERLSREWSIETGILERLYTIDHGITQLLIEQGIDAAFIPHGATNIPVPELITVIQDHRDALEGLFDFISSHRPLTTSYICQLHQVITRSQNYADGMDQFGNKVKVNMEHGQWKKLPNSPTRPAGSIHEYCPPIHVQSEMDRLIEMFNQHQNIPPEINAAWLHHRFTQIHPFQDGNGRVARALATIVFLQAGWFPLVLNRTQNGKYIAALEAADQHEMRPLAQLFGSIALKSFSNALVLSDDVLLEEKFLPKVLDNVITRYMQRRAETENTYQLVEDLSQKLREETNKVLEETSANLQGKFAYIPIHPIFRVMLSSPDNEHLFTLQIAEIARQLGYWANSTRRRMWVRLNLIDQFSSQNAQIIYSFHYLGKINHGVMAASGFIFFPERKSAQQNTDDPAEQLFGESQKICEEPFFFSYHDNQRSAEVLNTFQKWLNDTLAAGIAEWAKRL